MTSNPSRATRITLPNAAPGFVSPSTGYVSTLAVDVSNNAVDAQNESITGRLRASQNEINSARSAVETLMGNINVETLDVMLHEMGHGFGLSDYYNWKGSTPAGGSVMMIGSARGLSVGDQWMVRRYWRETKLLRYR